MGQTFNFKWKYCTYKVISNLYIISSNLFLQSNILGLVLFPKLYNCNLYSVHEQSYYLVGFKFLTPTWNVKRLWKKGRETSAHLTIIITGLHRIVGPYEWQWKTPQKNSFTAIQQFKFHSTPWNACTELIIKSLFCNLTQLLTFLDGANCFNVLFSTTWWL